jgi:hypothetical protein
MAYAKAEPGQALLNPFKSKPHDQSDIAHDVHVHIVDSHTFGP